MLAGMAGLTRWNLTFSIVVTIVFGFDLHAASAQTAPINATVCEVIQNPAAFDNKAVRLRATLAGNFEISSIRDPAREDCGSMWFVYAGSGPTASVSLNVLTPESQRPVVHLQRDKAFRHFEQMVAAKMYARNRKTICMDCHRYEVTATMTGLVEYAGPNKGFGHLNGFSVQFVLRSIEATSVKDLASRYDVRDFSTTPIRFPTGYITGVLRDADGKPVEDGDLTVYLATDPDAHIEDDSATTDEKGRFRFALPPGKYVIGFNTVWPPSAKFPYPSTYYPNTHERSGATVVEIGDHQHRSGLVITLPKPLKPRVVAVKVTWPNGLPVDEANVWLSPKNDPTMVVGTSVSHTKADGTFDLIGFEGIDYILHADKYGGLARVSCIKPLLLRANRFPSKRIALSLDVVDYHTCTNSDIETPAEP
jgi:hypothetical protein